MWRHGCPQHRRHQAYYTWVMIIHWEHQESQAAVRHSEIKVRSRWRLVISSLCPYSKCQVSKLSPPRSEPCPFTTGKRRNKKRKRPVSKTIQSPGKIHDQGSALLKGNTDLKYVLKFGRFFHERNGIPPNLQLVQTVLWVPQCNTSLLFLWDPRAALPKQEPLRRQNGLWTFSIG